MTLKYRTSVRFKRRNSQNRETKEIGGSSFRNENLDTVIFDEHGQEVHFFFRTGRRYGDDQHAWQR